MLAGFQFPGGTWLVSTLDSQAWGPGSNLSVLIGNKGIYVIKELLFLSGFSAQRKR